MACTLNELYRFDLKYWKVKGYIALRMNITAELARLDSVLRHNAVGFTARQTDEINVFERTMREMTVDGRVAYPVYYFKRGLNALWKVGRATPTIDAYPQVGGRFAYSHLWVTLRCGVFNAPVCLAVLAGTMINGLACMHPKIVRDPCEKFLVSCTVKDNLKGMYTLSGYIRTKNM
jgi:hypothetical protein